MEIGIMLTYDEAVSFSWNGNMFWTWETSGLFILHGIDYEYERPANFVYIF